MRASGGREHDPRRDEPDSARVPRLAPVRDGCRDREPAAVVRRAGRPGSDRRLGRDRGGDHRASDPLRRVAIAHLRVGPGEDAPVRLKESWKAHGAYMGFMISLFSEMYGFPLTIYLLSSAAPNSPLFVGYVWGVGQLVGSPIVIAGLLLIYKGWKEIVFQRGDVLVTDGIYTVVRHPQYLGFMLVTLGQFVVWPTIATAILWPLLAVLYYRQAKREEAILFEKFGDRFREYASKTPMFFPKIPLRRGPKPVSP